MTQLPDVSEILSAYRCTPLCTTGHQIFLTVDHFTRTSLTESTVDDRQSMLQLFPYVRIGW